MVAEDGIKPSLHVYEACQLIKVFSAILKFKKANQRSITPNYDSLEKQHKQKTKFVNASLIRKTIKELES